MDRQLATGRKLLLTYNLKWLHKVIPFILRKIPGCDIQTNNKYFFEKDIVYKSSTNDSLLCAKQCTEDLSCKYGWSFDGLNKKVKT